MYIIIPTTMSCSKRATSIALVLTICFTSSSPQIQLFSTNNEYEFFIELAYTECLSWYIEVFKHHPFLGLSVIILTCIERSYIWFATFILLSICHTSENINHVFEEVDDMVSSSIVHHSQWIEFLTVFIKNESFLREFLWIWIITTNHEQLTLRVDTVATCVLNIEIVSYHNCLGHIISNFVRVKELGSLFEVEDPWMNILLEGIFELEITREVESEELVHFGLHILSRSRISKRKIIILTINREILGNNIVKLVNHSSDCLNLISINRR
jgi:hypothetical protein